MPTTRHNTDDDRGEFSVWEFFPDGSYQAVVRWVDVLTAMQRAKREIDKPAATVGIIAEVRVTDGGDCIAFQWQYGKGIVYPTKEMMKDYREGQCKVCGGKGWIETKVWANARYYSSSPAATRVVCPTCEGKRMNAINVIAPYKHHGMWVFDDARVGLEREPFVAGADLMIDRIVADIPNAEKGFTLIFSGSPFPDHQYQLDWKRSGNAGNWYFSEQLGMEGWLCPALLRYFWKAPKQLYVQVKGREP